MLSCSEAVRRLWAYLGDQVDVDDEGLPGRALRVVHPVETVPAQAPPHDAVGAPDAGRPGAARALVRALREGDAAAAEAIVIEDARGGLGDLLAGARARDGGATVPAATPPGRVPTG